MDIFGFKCKNVVTCVASFSGCRSLGVKNIAPRLKFLISLSAKKANAPEEAKPFENRIALLNYVDDVVT